MRNSADNSPRRRPVRWLPPGSVRQGHLPGLRTGKTTAAAVLAYVIAQQLGTSAQPVLASLTALLVVQLTMYETVAHGMQRVASVLAGVLVAIGVATYVGLSWWSLGAVVGLSLVLGLALRLGPHLLEVPISAMLVLAVGGAEQAALDRVYETVVGALVGILVNAVIAAPLHVRPAGDAMARLADRLAGFLTGLATQLGSGWSRADAEHWLNEARALGAEVARADRTLARAEQSARLNPRGARARAAQPRLRTALVGLEHAHVSLRGLCRALFDRTFSVPDSDGATAYDPAVRAALAETLECTAEAIRTVGVVATGAGPVPTGARGTEPTGARGTEPTGPGGTAPAGAGGSVPPRSDAVAADPVAAARRQVGGLLAEQRRRRDRLGQLLAVDAQADQAAWQQHGALLAGLDRLRVETEAAVRPPTDVWRPALISDQQRRVVRRVRTAASQAAVELRPQRLRRRGRRGDAT